jgi:plastocyanin
MHTFWRRATAATAAVLLLGVAACGDDGDSDSSATTGTTEVSVPDHIEIGAGLNDPEDANIAVLEFLPAEVTVEVGTEVSWAWSGAEPHSVTFLAPGQTLPEPGTDPSVFEPAPASGPIDGSTYVNSGLQPLGPGSPTSFEASFAAPGDFTYYCVIHPGMVGKVTVVAAGSGDVDTNRTVAEARAADAATYLAEGRAAKAALTTAKPESTENADGSTTWTVEMGTTTEHTDVLAFAPTPRNVRAGDTVTFVNASGAPHTASFFMAGAEPITNPLDPRVDPPSPGPSPQALALDGFFNTGLLPPDAPPGAGPPLAARSFSFTVPAAGTYPYVCLLHAPSDMTGTIEAT